LIEGRLSESDPTWTAQRTGARVIAFTSTLSFTQLASRERL